MARYAKLLRFPVLLVIAIYLGFLVQHTPGMLTVQLTDGSGSITVPDSLERWRLEPGEGDVLLQGGTAFDLQTLELVRTNVPVEGGDLSAYIDARNDQIRRAVGDYTPRLRGEVRRFANGVAVPTGLGVFPAPFAGRLWTTTYWVHDLYFVHQGQYTRLTLTYPEFARHYLSIDHRIIGPHVRLEP